MRPVVFIYETGVDAVYLSEICAGLEEEGVPFAVCHNNHDDEKKLAFDAANHSRLHVGIGITAEAAALQIRNCQPEKPIFFIGLHGATNADLRKLGTNAGRAVKGGVFI